MEISLIKMVVSGLTFSSGTQPFFKHIFATFPVKQTHSPVFSDSEEPDTYDPLA